MPTDNLHSAPDNAPIILTLDSARAMLLMRLTASYSCRDFQARLDYALAEASIWQSLHGCVANKESDSAIVEAVHDAYGAIYELVEVSIRETLNE